MLAYFLIDDRPDRPVPSTPLTTRLGEAARLRVTWELSALYAIGFGGIVAFGVYLPTYLKTWYELDATDAGTRAAGFALVAVVFRPIGGWLSDRIHPAVVTAWALGAVAVLGVVQAFEPALMPGATICLLVMAAALGATSGAVFALVARVTPQPQVGSVTGIVGAAPRTPTPSGSCSCPTSPWPAVSTPTAGCARPAARHRHGRRRRRSGSPAEAGPGGRPHPTSRATCGESNYPSQC